MAHERPAGAIVGFGIEMLCVTPEVGYAGAVMIEVI